MVVETNEECNAARLALLDRQAIATITLPYRDKIQNDVYNLSCQISTRSFCTNCMQKVVTRSFEGVEDKTLLHLKVAKILRDKITYGELEPGLRLTERVLCEELKVSRTPLREALKTLASEGLVELLQNCGAMVTPMTLTDTTDTFKVLSVLEGLAGELACGRADEANTAELRRLHEQMREHYNSGNREKYFELNQEIHARIFQLAANPVLLTTRDKLNLRLRRARYFANIGQSRWDRAMQEHDQIIAALEARNGKRLRLLLEEHIRNKCDVVIAALLSSGAVSAIGAPTTTGLALNRRVPKDGQALPRVSRGFSR